MSASTATTTSPLWQDIIHDQLQEIMTAEILDEQAIATRPYLVISFDRDEHPTLLARVETSDQADEECVLHAGKGDLESITVALLADVGFDVPAAELDPDDVTVTVDGEEIPGTVETRPDDSEPGEQADDDTSGLPPAANAAKGELFDASDYEREDLAIPKVDGNQIDQIAIKVSGRIMLDRSSPADVALFSRLKLNQDVELRCAGKVTGLGTGFTTGKDGDIDAVVSSKNLKVDTVWVLDPEEL